MPYLRITCQPVTPERRRQIAQALTDTVNDLFFNPKAPTSREELRERTTVHFVPYETNEVFVGARTPEERGQTDITVEVSDWGMSVRQQRKVAAGLTPKLAELFGVPASGLDAVNIRFHSYPPTDFAVGGRLLADVVPRIAQVMKRLFE